MKKNHGIRTYLRVCFDSEPQGLFDALTRNFDCPWQKEKYAYRTEVNTNYDVDVNNMLRVTLAPFFGKEEEMKNIANEFGVEFVLEIVPELYASSPQPTPILSLDKDIVAFLYLSGASHDLDLYLLK